MEADRAPMRSGVEVRQAVAAFAQPSGTRGALQLLTSFGAFLAACISMYLVYPISPWLALALAVPAGALLVRVFIVQHDCGHGSFFASTRANAIVGRACSLITLTPFTNWARQHSLHHRNWSNLDRRKGADLYSACLTVREYLALSPWQRLLHRLPRHPVVANLVLPPLVFLVLYRVPFDTPRKMGARALVGPFHQRRPAGAVRHAGAGVRLAGGADDPSRGHGRELDPGVWLFSLQHRFETARWTRRADWNPMDASMEASSWFGLPRVLHWLTGNIGFHHVHHLNPRVPSYRLSAAHDAVRALWPIEPLSLRGGLRAPWFTLWDEARGRLVSFRDVTRAAA